MSAGPRDRRAMPGRQACRSILAVAPQQAGQAMRGWSHSGSNASKQTGRHRPGLPALVGQAPRRRDAKLCRAGRSLGEASNRKPTQVQVTACRCACGVTVSQTLEQGQPASDWQPTRRTRRVGDVYGVIRLMGTP